MTLITREDEMMLKRTVSTALLAVGLAMPLALHAQMPRGVERSISGKVVDVSCLFGLGLSGADHRMCAQVCADKGIPLAILGSDGLLYLPTTAAMPGDGQNARLREFAEQEVTVTGLVFPAGGANAIQIATIRRKA